MRRTSDEGGTDRPVGRCGERGKGVTSHLRPQRTQGNPQPATKRSSSQGSDGEEEGSQRSKLREGNRSEFGRRVDGVVGKDRHRGEKYWKGRVPRGPTLLSTPLLTVHSEGHRREDNVDTVDV